MGSKRGYIERRKMICCYVMERVLGALLKSRSFQSLVLSGVNAGGLIEGQKADSLGFCFVSKFVKIVGTSAERLGLP